MEGQGKHSHTLACWMSLLDFSNAANVITMPVSYKNSDNLSSWLFQKFLDTITERVDENTRRTLSIWGKKIQQLNDNWQDQTIVQREGSVSKPVHKHHVFAVRRRCQFPVSAWLTPVAPRVSPTQLRLNRQTQICHLNMNLTVILFHHPNMTPYQTFHLNQSFLDRHF